MFNSHNQNTKGVKVNVEHLVIFEIPFQIVANNKVENLYINNSKVNVKQIHSPILDFRIPYEKPNHFINIRHKE